MFWSVSATRRISECVFRRDLTPKNGSRCNLMIWVG